MNGRAAARYGTGVVALALLTSAASLPSVGCHRASADSTAATGDAAPMGSPVVRDDSQGLLLTWIDDKGDFHVEQSTKDVPLVGRDAVRVVDPSRADGEGDNVFVADLRVAGGDGSFPVHPMTREDFDALAVARREKSSTTLAMANGADAGARQLSTDNAVAGRPAVIVYGASWCSACHQAEAYFKQHGIFYVEKDIEKDEAAAAEMRAKLKRAGLQGGSIPVLDVRGHVMIGFNPGTVEQALGSPI